MTLPNIGLFMEAEKRDMEVIVKTEYDMEHVALLAAGQTIIADFASMKAKIVIYTQQSDPQAEKLEEQYQRAHLHYEQLQNDIDEGVMLGTAQAITYPDGQTRMIYWISQSEMCNYIFEVTGSIEALHACDSESLQQYMLRKRKRGDDKHEQLCHKHSECQQLQQKLDHETSYKSPDSPYYNIRLVSMMLAYHHFANDYRDRKKGAMKQIRTWLEATFPDMSDSEMMRIQRTINWNPQGGAPSFE